MDIFPRHSCYSSPVAGATSEAFCTQLKCDCKTATCIYGVCHSPSTVNMSEQPKEEKSDTHINLKVSDGTAEIFFKIKKTTPMKRLMDAFCKRQGKSMESLRFLIDGARVSPDNTPEDLELEDGDVIEAHREQVGGFL